MKSVRLVIVQFSDPAAGEPAMEPFLMMVDDDPHWEALVAASHGVIPSAMHVVELGRLGEDRDTLSGIRGIRLRLSSIVNMYLGGLHTSEGILWWIPIAKPIA